jgi:hypothetical protein
MYFNSSAVSSIENNQEIKDKDMARIEYEIRSDIEESKAKMILRSLIFDLSNIDPADLTFFEYHFLRAFVVNPPPQPKKVFG